MHTCFFDIRTCFLDIRIKEQVLYTESFFSSRESCKIMRSGCIVRSARSGLPGRVFARMVCTSGAGAFACFQPSHRRCHRFCSSRLSRDSREISVRMSEKRKAHPECRRQPTVPYLVTPPWRHIGTSPRYPYQQPNSIFYPKQKATANTNIPTFSLSSLFFQLTLLSKTHARVSARRK